MLCRQHMRIHPLRNYDKKRVSSTHGRNQVRSNYTVQVITFPIWSCLNLDSRDMAHTISYFPEQKERLVWRTTYGRYHVISLMSCCYKKIPWQKLLMGERFYLAQNSSLPFITEGSQGGENLKQPVILYPQSKAESDESRCTPVQFCFPFYLVQSPAHEMVPPTFRVGLPTSINSIKRSPHSRPTRHANLDISSLRLLRWFRLCQQPNHCSSSIQTGYLPQRLQVQCRVTQRWDRVNTPGWSNGLKKPETPPLGGEKTDLLRAGNSLLVKKWGGMKAC